MATFGCYNLTFYRNAILELKYCVNPLSNYEVIQNDLIGIFFIIFKVASKFYQYFYQ